MLKVFIVEDHPVIRQTYALVLKREADMVICGEASSAEEALAMIPACAPDIVLIDISLPQMSGLELVQHLQAEQPGLPTIVISGHQEAVFIEGVLAIGATQYIVKEQAVHQLVDTIRQLINP